jgi:uroporphyrinogen decarboxylase
MMKAARREPVERTPIWLIGQAGRYLPEYRRMRQRVSMIELCKAPDLCAEIALMAVNRLGADAAIVFSGLPLILEAMGLPLEFAGERPVLKQPIRTAGGVDRLLELEGVEPLGHVIQAVRKTRAALAEALPLIGSAGAPFSLAAYVIEGGSRRDCRHAKALMYTDTGAWDALMGRLARAVTLFFRAQIEAGAQIVQLFDRWAGCLGQDDYRRYVLPYTRSVIESLPRDVPVIHFAAGNPALLPLLGEAFGKRTAGTVLGVDWRIGLEEAFRMIGHERAIQGNLDPAVLLASPLEIRRRAKEILRQAAGRPGHIFNLGHGVLSQTPPEHAVALVDAVHEYSGRK